MSIAAITKVMWKDEDLNHLDQAIGPVWVVRGDRGADVEKLKDWYTRREAAQIAKTYGVQMEEV